MRLIFSLSRGLGIERFDTFKTPLKTNRVVVIIEPIDCLKGRCEFCLEILSMPTECPNCNSSDFEECVDEWSMDYEVPLDEQVLKTYRWCNGCNTVIDEDD